MEKNFELTPEETNFIEETLHSLYDDYYDRNDKGNNMACDILNRIRRHQDVLIPKWEYKVEYFDIEDIDNGTEQLNANGEIGWELVQIHKGCGIFKRKVQN